jgi:hypothetical protein
MLVGSTMLKIDGLLRKGPWLDTNGIVLCPARLATSHSWTCLQNSSCDLLAERQDAGCFIESALEARGSVALSHGPLFRATLPGRSSWKLGFPWGWARWSVASWVKPPPGIQAQGSKVVYQTVGPAKEVDSGDSSCLLTLSVCHANRHDERLFSGAWPQ